MNELISVVIPAFNEKSNIGLLIDELNAELEGRDYEIIIVDDNSPDGTYEAALQKTSPRLKAFKRASEKGFAKSIRFGIEHSKGAVIVIMDSDFDHYPKYVKPLLLALAGRDCAVASRFIPGASANLKLRQRLSGLYNVFIRLVTGGRLSDYLFGFIALRRDVLSGLDFDSIFYGFGDYCIRLLTALERVNARVIEIPAEHGSRKAGRSGNKLLKTFCIFTKETIKLALCIKR